MFASGRGAYDRSPSSIESRYSQILRMFLPPPCTGKKKHPIRKFGRGQLAQPQGRSKNFWYASKVHKMYEYTLLMQTRKFLNVLGARPAGPSRAGVWLAFLILYTGIGGWRQKHPAVAVHASYWSYFLESVRFFFDLLMLSSRASPGRCF